MSMIDYQRIIKECFWDIQMQPSDIDNIADSSDIAKKRLLFEKILLNSTQMFQDLLLFKNDELKVLLTNFNVPRFNKEYIAKRKNMVEVYFFDKPLTIDELRWIA